MVGINKNETIGDFSIEITNNIVYLIHNGRSIMSSSQYEWDTNKDIIEKSFGDVLIVGLGIGLIVLPIQEKQEVTSITILEKYQEIIDLIVPKIPLNNKVNIIKGDLFTHQFNNTFDTLYCDIFGYEEVELRKWFIDNYSKYKKNEESFIDSWLPKHCYLELDNNGNAINSYSEKLNDNCIIFISDEDNILEKYYITINNNGSIQMIRKDAIL